MNSVSEYRARHVGYSDQLEGRSNCEAGFLGTPAEVCIPKALEKDPNVEGLDHKSRLSSDAEGA